MNAAKWQNIAGFKKILYGGWDFVNSHLLETERWEYVDLTHPNVHTINCVSGLVAALHSVKAITSNGTFYDIPFEKDHTFFSFPNIFFNGCEYAVDCYRYENAWTIFLLYGERDILQIWYFVQKIILTWCTVKRKYWMGFHPKKFIKNLWCF